MGKKIFYQLKENRKENSEAIILIHGSGENSDVWENQLEGIKTRFNLIAVDLPSHGKSDTFSELTLELYVNVVESLINELGIMKVILGGHSLGGAVTLSTYFKNPENKIGLILCATGARLRVSPVIFEMIESGLEEYIKYVPAAAFYRKTSNEIIENTISQVSTISPQVIYSDYSICNKFDVIDKISSIDIPCLILAGYADKLTPLKYAQFFNDQLKNSTLHVIRNAAHMVMVEKPEEVNQFIRDFIEKRVQQ